MKVTAIDLFFGFAAFLFFSFNTSNNNFATFELTKPRFLEWQNKKKISSISCTVRNRQCLSKSNEIKSSERHLLENLRKRKNTQSK